MGDQLALASAFEDAGIERAKAERVAPIIFVRSTTMATNADVQASAASLHGEIASVRTDLANLRGEVAPTGIVCSPARPH